MGAMVSYAAITRAITREPPAAATVAPGPVGGRARDLLVSALGLLWLLDAALQFQPYMFTSAFVKDVIEPAAAGNPSFVAGPVTWAAHLMGQHIALYNALFATTQLLIAVGLFVPRTRKLALGGSVVYALIVWYLGEGLGGILTGASPLAGVPGGVVLYALTALLLWPADNRQKAPAFNGKLGKNGALVAWATLWLSFSYYFVLPANRAARAMAHLFAASGAGEPGWLRAVETALANGTGNGGAQASLVLAVLCAAVAIGMFFVPRASVVLAAAMALFIWVAEAFGGLFTGTATDPNTGLVLVLLAACYWPYAEGRQTHMQLTPDPDGRLMLPPDHLLQTRKDNQ